MVVGGEWRYEGGRTGYKSIFLCRGDKGRGMAAEREWQSCRGKPTWMCANGTSARSRLVAIRYPKRLKYYAGWLMLTAWPLRGDCVAIVSVFLQDCSKFHFCGQGDYGFLEVLFGRPSAKKELRDRHALQSNGFSSLQHRFITLSQSLVMLGVK